MMEIIEFFKSKKHSVCKVDNKGCICVLKKYTDKHALIKENDILNFLVQKKLNVPEVLMKSDRQLYLEYINGITLMDYFTELEIDLSEGYENFLNRFAEFHKSLYCFLGEYKENMILGDMNFRNYIIMGRKISRIDFEDCVAGNIETDIGKMAAFALTYDPSFTNWKKKFVERMIDVFSGNLNLSKEKIRTEMKKELENIKIRRKW